MIIISKGRANGKTTEAIKLASSTGSLLVVRTDIMKHIVEGMARDMKYPVDVCTAEEYFGHNFKQPRGQYRERIVIDDLEAVLREVFGCDIIMATTMGFPVTMKEIDGGIIAQEPDLCRKVEFEQPRFRGGRVNTKGKVPPSRR